MRKIKNKNRPVVVKRRQPTPQQSRQEDLPEGLTGSYLIISQVTDQINVLNQVERILRQRARDEKVSIEMDTVKVKNDILVRWYPAKEQKVVDEVPNV
jgi:hypothetical protein